jgi:hypothetical protein
MQPYLNPTRSKIKFGKPWEGKELNVKSFLKQEIDFFFKDRPSLTTLHPLTFIHDLNHPPPILHPESFTLHHSVLWKKLEFDIDEALLVPFYYSEKLKKLNFTQI